MNDLQPTQKGAETWATVCDNMKKIGSWWKTCFKGDKAFPKAKFSWLTLKRIWVRPEGRRVYPWTRLMCFYAHCLLVRSPHLSALLDLFLLPLNQETSFRVSLHGCSYFCVFFFSVPIHPPPKGESAQFVQLSDSLAFHLTCSRGSFLGFVFGPCLMILKLCTVL